MELRYDIEARDICLETLKFKYSTLVEHSHPIEKTTQPIEKTSQPAEIILQQAEKIQLLENKFRSPY